MTILTDEFHTKAFNFCIPREIREMSKMENYAACHSNKEVIA